MQSVSLIVVLQIVVILVCSQEAVSLETFYADNMATLSSHQSCVVVDGPLACIDSLAIVNSAAMNIWVHEPFQNSVSLFFFHISPQVDLLDHTVVLFLVFRAIATLCSNSDCTSLHSHQLC